MGALGLVDAVSEKDFREKLCALKDRWEKFEYMHRSVPQGKEYQAEFHTWFVTEKANVVAKCMLHGVRKKAGLGDNPDHFFTNMCESMNKTLKCHTNYKEHLSLKKCMHLCSHRKIFFRNDHWRFRQEYQHLEVDADKWFTLSEKAQQAHIRKILTELLGSVQRYIEVAEESKMKMARNYQ